MSRVAVLTSFHRAGFEAHGRQMLESFDRFWPSEVQMYAYSEDCHPRFASERILVRDLLQCSRDLVAFRERHRSNPRAHGWTERRYRLVVQWHKMRIKLRRVQAKDTYRWQAVRFCHKPFAIFHAARHVEADILFWLDADMLMRDQITPEVIRWLIPPDAMLSCIKRPKFSDCCIIGFNLRHPRIGDFFEHFRQLYVSDKLFRYREYHDSYLFDIVRQKFERQGCLTHDMSEGVGTLHGHVFDHCRLGRYMDHLKGVRKGLPPPPPMVALEEEREPVYPL